MTLDEMQTVWSEMTTKIEQQEHLTNQLIMEMTQTKFRNKIGTINKYESGGAIICFIAALLLILNIDKLDTWYLMACGIFVILYLIFIPMLVLRSIINMKQINIVANTYKQSLMDFAKRRKHFLLMQRIAIFSNIILTILILPVFSKISKGKDLFMDGGNVWYWYLPLMLVFLVPFSRWGYTTYKKMTASAEQLIKDLQTEPS